MSKPSNQTIAEKADIAVADLTANGGILLPEQSNSFLDLVYNQSTIINGARMVRMGRPQMYIEKLGFASRILRPAPESGVALTAAERAKVTTSKIQLTTKELIAEVNIPYDVLEDNIEKGNLENTIMQHMAKQVAYDLEEWSVLADTTSSDAFLALEDGFLKRGATSHTVSLSSPNNTINKSIFKQAIKALPAKYFRNRSDFRFYLSPGQEAEWRDVIADRQTAMGDATIEGYRPALAYGVPIAPATIMPDSKMLFTHPQNLIFGVQRDIMIETDKDIRSRMYVIVLTMRACVQIEETDAVVVVSGLA